MQAPSILRITRSVLVPEAELEYRASRSGGPGGQHANTSSTRIELLWNVRDTPSLSEAQRRRVMRKLDNRISKEGELQLAEGGSRSQHRNKEEVTQRFVELLRDALKVPKPRKKKKISRAAHERRLKNKKHRSELKKKRRRVRREY